MAGSFEWAANVDPAGEWQMLPADRLLKGDRFWNGGTVREVKHVRDPETLELSVMIDLAGHRWLTFPGSELIQTHTRQVDPNRLGLMSAAVARAGVPAEQVDGVARDLVRRGVPLLQARFVVAGEDDPAARFQRSGEGGR